VDTGFFLLSKLLGIFLQLETWLLLGLLSSLLASMKRRLRLAQVTTLVTLVLFLALTTLPLGALLLKPLERAFPPQAVPGHIDGIVILGGVEDHRASAYWGQPQINQAAERLTGAAGLALHHPQARVVFSGGSGRLRDLGSGEGELAPVAIEVLTGLGVAPDRITWEAQSRNTAENALFSLEMVQPNPNEVWVLVTSAFHMRRAMASFEAAGWTSISPYPVDFRTADLDLSIGWGLAGNLDTLNIAVKEWVGLLVYRATGR
jgi:uncharacterized SAM-binding protein YcdF (DUF218 family)